MSSTTSPRTYAKATMYVGIAATLGGNAAAADWSDALAVVISALPALALLLTFEMIVRGKAVPSRRCWHHKAARIVPALAIMGISAYASYGHLLQVATEHGQRGVGAYLVAALPDAMMLLATVILKDTPQPRTTPARRTDTAPAPVKAKAKAPAKARKTAPAAPAAKPAPVPARTPAIILAPARRGRRLAIA